MVASHAAPVEDLAEVTLKPVDEGGQALGIDEVEVSRRTELANRILQLIEFVPHGDIISNKCTKRKR